MPRFLPTIHLLLPWARDLTTLCLSFLSCKMELNTANHTRLLRALYVLTC